MSISAHRRSRAKRSPAGRSASAAECQSPSASWNSNRLSAFRVLASTQNLPPFLVPALLLFVPVWFCFLVWLLATLSGWRQMARQFRQRGPIESGQVRTWQSGRIGWVNYNNCLKVSIGPAGIGLKMMPPFNLFSPPLLLPWSALSEPRARKILWNEVVQFEVGQPPIGSITLPKKLFSGSPDSFTKTGS